MKNNNKGSLLMSFACDSRAELEICLCTKIIIQSWDSLFITYLIEYNNYSTVYITSMVSQLVALRAILAQIETFSNCVKSHAIDQFLLNYGSFHICWITATFLDKVTSHTPSLTEHHNSPHKLTFIIYKLNHNFHLFISHNLQKSLQLLGKQTQYHVVFLPQ